MSIPIAELVPTQDYIRNEKQIPGMIKWVEGGGIFDQDSIEAHLPNSSVPHSLMRIVQFDDGALFLSDGHHRTIGILEGGRDELHKDEFFIERWSYQDYMDVVFTYPDGKWMGWITPHDPWKEIRLPELSNFKFEVKKIWKDDGEGAALRYIQENKEKYCKPRTINSIRQLVDNYRQVSKKHGLFFDKYKDLSESQKLNPTCKACAGSGRNSRGDGCLPCGGSGIQRVDQDRDDYSERFIMMSGWSGL